MINHVQTKDLPHVSASYVHLLWLVRGWIKLTKMRANFLGSLVNRYVACKRCQRELRKRKNLLRNFSSTDNMRRKVPPTWYPKLALQLLKICDTAENISSACRLEGKSILLIHGGTKGAKMVQAVLDTLFGCPQLLVLNVNLSTSEGSQKCDGQMATNGHHRQTQPKLKIPCNASCSFFLRRAIERSFSRCFSRAT